jgi:thymidylate kinase
VREAYLARAASSGDRFRTIDSEQSIEEIRKILEVDVLNY